MKEKWVKLPRPMDGELCLYHYHGLCVSPDRDEQSKLCEVHDRNECRDWTPLIKNE